MPPENGQVFLFHPVLRHGGDELTGGGLAAGEEHETAGDLIQAVDGGDIVRLMEGPVMRPQKSGHGGGAVAVLGQDTNGLYTQDQGAVLIKYG